MDAKKPSKTGLRLKLVGEDGNAFSIIGKARAALRRNGYAADIETFTREATAGDYNHLLAVCTEWFEVE